MADVITLATIVAATPTLDAWTPVVKGDPCCYCQGPSDTVEHVTPITDGGRTNSDNLVGCCYACNHLRGASRLLVFLCWNRDRTGAFVGQVGAGTGRSRRRRRGATARGFRSASRHHGPRPPARAFTVTLGEALRARPAGPTTGR